MTQKNKIALFVCFVIVVGSYFFRSAAFGLMQFVDAVTRPRPAERKVVAPKTAPQADAVIPIAPVSALSGYAGTWSGGTALYGRGICTMQFEFKPKGEDQFTGYSTLTCKQEHIIRGSINQSAPSAIINSVNPEAAILTGKEENGALVFQTEKVIGADTFGCAPTSVTLTPFGSSGLALEWTEEKCPGGHLIVSRVRR